MPPRQGVAARADVASRRVSSPAASTAAACRPAAADQVPASGRPRHWLRVLFARGDTCPLVAARRDDTTVWPNGVMRMDPRATPLPKNSNRHADLAHARRALGLRQRRILRVGVDLHEALLAADLSPRRTEPRRRPVRAEASRRLMIAFEMRKTLRLLVIVNGEAEQQDASKR
jgi:hypothetical protein